MRSPLPSYLVLILAAAACGAPDGAVVDAASGTDGAVPATCDGACRTTALTARFGTTTRTLERAAYGMTIGAGQAPTVRVEAYHGGAAGCPTEASPTPDYTLVLGAMPVPTSAAAVTSPANLLDFVGDLLGGALGARATAVSLTPVAVDVCPTCVGGAAPSDPDGLIALDLSLTFAGGTVAGHLFATHCDSLDTRE